MKEIPYGRFLEEFEVGDTYSHSVCKTLTESDNNLFSLLTMNHHPVHLNSHYAKEQYHGEILVVGTLVFSLVVGLTVADISGKAVANLDYESIKHKAPVFIGDTIRAETEVLEIRRSESNPNRGIVYVETKAFNQNDDEILSFRRHVLVKSKNA